MVDRVNEAVLEVPKTDGVKAHGVLLMRIPSGRVAPAGDDHEIESVRRRRTRRHQTRRLSEDRNQHYDDLQCPCWHDPRAMARFKEQPKLRGCWMCGDPRRFFTGEDAITMQERRFAEAADDGDGAPGTPG